MRIFLNGQEMQFVEGGYEYVFMKPYQRHQQKTVQREHGKLLLQLYDNGVQIRTLITKEEVATIINREVAIDAKNKKIYILEAGDRAIEHPDGSVEVTTKSS